MPANIRIRMYRTGFGDCFLASFDAGGSTHHVLIDFGAHVRGEIGTMDSIMDDLETETGRKLDLLVATHAHRDHISGFGRFADRFSQFDIGEIWLPWTDNSKDHEANALERRHLALYERLENHLNATRAAGRTDPLREVALDALSNLRGNERAKAELARAFGTGAKAHYLGAGDSFAKVAGVPGLSAEILGPPRDKRFFSRMNPPEGQHFLTVSGGTDDAVHPFPDFEIRPGSEEYLALVKAGEEKPEQRQPLVTEKDLIGLHEQAEVPAGRLALALDNYRNNTSLVILFRFRGKTLLFPGDAQWGSWQSWIETDRAAQLLGEIDFLKVAHHGSENATPVGVVNALRTAGLAVMVPTQVEPFPTIPRVPLLDELQKHCVGHVAVRSDWIEVPAAPPPPKPKPSRLPKGFKSGARWIDYSL